MCTCAVIWDHPTLGRAEWQTYDSRKHYLPATWLAGSKSLELYNPTLNWENNQHSLMLFLFLSHLFFFTLCSYAHHSVSVSVTQTWKGLPHGDQVITAHQLQLREPHVYTRASLSVPRGQGQRWNPSLVSTPCYWTILWRLSPFETSI